MLSRLVTETLQPAIFDTGKDSDLSGIEIDCNKDGLFTRSEYDMCMNRQNQDDASLFVRAHPDYLSTVPLPCNSSRGEILIFCEKIVKSFLDAAGSICISSYMYHFSRHMLAVRIRK